ncbi:beta-galactosidase [Micromonospora arida]|uniref:beta-galactosidase n=1 Tax=Micromonospora arida TaxID=2203715 RepID=UPI0033A5F2B0
MSLPLSAKVPFGGDYNPEQWPEDVWKQDYRLFDTARIDLVTLGVFDWALTQPAEDTYDFTLLDRIVERASAEGRGICLATGTGAHPPWLAKAYPEVTRTDFEGRKRRFGQRHNSCPSSPVFRRLSTELARRVARRYADTPAVLAWHVGNEYGGACYCALCAAGFRNWLRQRYGTLDELNEAWYTTFWSHTFTDWDEIEPPSALTEHWRGPDHTAFVAAGLDQAGVSWVVRQVLARHDLLGPYPDVPDLESAVRVAADGSRLLFLLNHRAEPVEVTARTGGVDLLTGDRTAAGAALRLPAYGVVVLKEDR